MNKEFDFESIGKRMPYTTPDGFFDQLEENIWKEVKDDFQKTDETSVDASGKPQTGSKTVGLRLLTRSALAVAASLALVLVVAINFPKTDKASINDVDQAFSQLTTDDQTYLLSVYQEDVFINE